MSIILNGTNGVSASGGLYAANTFTGTYTDGIVVDYINGNGRISVGGGDGITFYNNGVSGSSLAQIAANGNFYLTAGMPSSGPAFSAYTSAQVSVSNNVVTKIPFNTKEFDTNNCFDSATNYRFTPNIPGYYQINALLYFGSGSSGYMRLYLYKNGSAYTQGNMVPFTSITGQLLVFSQCVYANGSDYFEIYGWQSAGGSVNAGSTTRNESYFGAFLARGA
jgi:hypothetical protein